MRKSRYVSATISIVFSVLLVSSFSTVVRAQGLFTQGDFWLYDQSAVYGSASVSGIMNVSYTGMSNRTVDGTAYVTYELQYNTSLMWSGTASGTTRSLETVYVDQSSENTVVDEYNESDDITFTSGGTISTVNGWTYNETVYNPPGGSGTWPSSVQVGDTWTITYTVNYTEVTFDGTSTNITMGSLVEPTTYTVTGTESVSVPAGTFDCTVIQISSPEYSYTRWYSDKVGNDVKITSGSGLNDSSTIVLRAYSYGATSNSQVSVLYVGIGAAIAAAAVIVVVLLVMRRKRAKPADLQQPVTPGRPPETPPYY